MKIKIAPRAPEPKKGFTKQKLTQTKGAKKCPQIVRNLSKIIHAIAQNIVFNIVQLSTKRTLKDNYVPLTDMRLKDLSKRTFKAEVELGYNKPESKKESSRCYLCHYQFAINNDLCVLCDECLLVRPVHECIKELSSKNIDDNGEVSFTKIEPGKSHGIYHGLLYIDPKVCVRCGECEKACPTGAISLTNKL